MKIHEFISEANWTQKALCRTLSGEICHWPYAVGVCQWCLGGMILYCYRPAGGNYELANSIFYLIEDKIGMPLNKWNDRPERVWTDIRDLCRELDI